MLRGALKHDTPRPNRQQRSGEPLKPNQIASSGRMTKAERAQILRIRFELAQQGITPQRWELQALARGAMVTFDGQNSHIRLLMSGRDLPNLKGEAL